jgi:hypothetical protein
MANLLDRASIVLTPTAYNNGEALCIKPDDGSGDFDFSRSSAATRVNAQGLVENVQSLGSEEVVNGSFDNGSANWTLGSSWSVSNGLAYTDGSAQNFISQNIGLVTGKTYNLSFDISNRVGTDGCIVIFGGATFSGNAFANGTQTFQATANGGIELRIYGFNGNTYNLDNVSVKEVIDNTNLPRINYEGFSYDSSGNIIPNSGCGSWLFEPQSTNLLTYSEDFSQWSVVSGSVNTNETISPDGTQNASKLNTTNAGSRLQQPLSFSGVNTISIFVKYAGDDVTVRFERNTSNDRCSFDVSSLGVVFNSAETGIIDYNVEEFSNDWYRISCSYDGGSYFQFNGDITGNGGSVYIWGAQAEDLSYATSYIPTSGSQVTRNQDVCNNGGSLATINSTEGTLYFEGKTTYDNTNSKRISLSDGSTSNRVSLEFDDLIENKLKVFITSNGVSEVLEYTAPNLSIYNKIAIKWKANDFAIWFNGSEVVVVTTEPSVPVGLTELSFDKGGSAKNFFGKTKCVAVWKEVLSDSEYQSLTTI